MHYQQITMSETLSEVTPYISMAGYPLPWEQDEHDRYEHERIYCEVHGHSKDCLCTYKSFVKRI